MKISKILAGMSAMALAASMMTMGASAEISNANFNDGKDYCFDVFAAVGAEKAATISSVRAKPLSRTLMILRLTAQAADLSQAATEITGSQQSSVTTVLTSQSHS